MATLINGNGNPAIYAAQDADLIASLAGNTTGIAKVGNEFSYTAEDANTISVADGVIVTKEGRRIQLDAGENDIFTIPAGTAGVTNYYIMGYHLHENASGQQVADTFVQLMASATDTIQEDTFRGGASDVYVSLYRVEQDGVNLGTITLLLPKLTNISQVDNDLSDKQNITDNSLNTVSKQIVGAINELLANFGNINAVEAIASWNDVDKTKVGYYYCTGGTPSNYTVGISISTSSDGNFGVQICVSFFNTTGKFYSRSWNGSTWGTWREYPTLSEAVAEATKVTPLGVTSWESMVTSTEALTFLQSGNVKILHLAVLGNFSAGTYNIGKLAVGPTYGAAYFTIKCGSSSTASGHGTIATDGTIAVHVTETCTKIVLQAVFI